MRWSSLVVLSLAVACSKEKPSEEKQAPAAAKKQEEKVAPGPLTKKKTEAPKKQPSKKTDSDKLAAYWKGMLAGRKATGEKKFPEAYAAFDKALVAIPDDARALSERGYAKLMAKDYKAAVVDLDRAVVRTADKKLLGQIFYNYGLAAEAQGDSAAAHAAFARSNGYNPTPAAKKKLDGKDECTAVISDKPPAVDTKTYASWKAAYDDAKHDYEDLAAWSSDESTLATFCTNGWKKSASCVAKLGSVAVNELRLYVPRPDGKIVMFPLDMVGGRCGGNIEATLKDEGDVAHLTWSSTQGISILVTEKNGEMVPCGEKDEDCTSACGDDSVTYADLFVAKDKGESMLFVSRAADGDKDPIKVTVDMPTVKIKGKGCDAERPLAK